MNKYIKKNQRKKINVNRRKATNVREQEAAAIRVLIERRQPEPNDVVGQCAASIIRVKRID